MEFIVRKQERETAQGLIRRFTRRVKDSGVLNQARKTRFRQHAKSKTVRKKTALRKLETRKEYEKLVKLGLK
ncbi:MAG: hypothetical protein Q7S63_01685 [bacterium]|nr:hypothetical protein [bacterium]